MRKINKSTTALAFTRARLGLTQQQMSEQLGISHSFVKMIETGKRFLSSEVLLKLAALEIRMTASPKNKTILPVCVQELYQHSGKDHTAKKISHETECSYKATHLQRKLDKMQADHAALISCLHNLEAISNSPYDKNGQLTNKLLLHRTSLLQKLLRCSPQAQVVLKNRIDMLNAVVSLNKNVASGSDY